MKSLRAFVALFITKIKVRKMDLHGPDPKCFKLLLKQCDHLIRLKL